MNRSKNKLADQNRELRRGKLLEDCLDALAEIAAVSQDRSEVEKLKELLARAERED